MSNSSIWHIDRTLAGATTPGQSWPESNGNESVLCIPQSSSITGASPSDCFMSYPGHLFGKRRGIPLCRDRVGVLYSPSHFIFSIPFLFLLHTSFFFCFSSFFPLLPFPSLVLCFFSLFLDFSSSRSCFVLSLLTSFFLSFVSLSNMKRRSPSLHATGSPHHCLFLLSAKQ